MAGSCGGAPAAEPLPPPVAATLSKRSQSSPVTKVLDNDDLLRKILFRLTFPVSLIRAALACKCWLGIASDPAFVCRFRKLHPPLIGFYLKSWRLSVMKFVAMPRTKELNTLISRAESVFDGNSNMWGLDFHSRNSRLLGQFHGHDSSRSVVLSPLNLQGSTVNLPPFPVIGKEAGMISYPLGYLLNDHACFAAILVYGQERTTVHLFELIDGAWQNHTSSTIKYCPVSCAGIQTLLGNRRLYMISWKNKILVLDFTSSVLSVIELPEGVECRFNLEMSQADDTGFNLVHIKELVLSVWLYRHKIDNSSNSVGGNWLLMHTIFLHEVFVNSRMLIPVPDNGKDCIVKLHAVGDNAEFVFFEICSTVFYLDTTNRTVEKVCTLPPDDGDSFSIHPFMMIWPPTFPCAQRMTGPKGMTQLERDLVNANKLEVLSLPPDRQGDASTSRSVVEMAHSKRHHIGKE